MPTTRPAPPYAMERLPRTRTRAFSRRLMPIVVQVPTETAPPVVVVVDLSEDSGENSGLHEHVFDEVRGRIGGREAVGDGARRELTVARSTRLPIKALVRSLSSFSCASRGPCGSRRRRAAQALLQLALVGREAATRDLFRRRKVDPDGRAHALKMNDQPASSMTAPPPVAEYHVAADAAASPEQQLRAPCSRKYDSHPCRRRFPAPIFSRAPRWSCRGR